MGTVNPSSTASLAAAAAAIGAAAWSGPAWAVAAASVLPALWSATSSRLGAGIVVLAYQLAATRGAPGGIARYYGSWFTTGAVLWILAGTLVAAAWAVLWHTSARRRPWLGLAALVATAVPPIGIVGWVHPATAAGVLFPGTGWWGVAGHTVLMVALMAAPLRLIAPTLALTSFCSLLALSTPPCSPGWAGVDTHYDFGGGAAAPLRDYERQLDLIAVSCSLDAHVVLLPESAAGRWTNATAGLWQPALRRFPSRVVLLGGEVPDRAGRSANALIAVQPDRVATVYRQRMPVPLTMWRPWTTGGTQAYWFANPVVQIAGRRAAVFICHEQVLVWPALHSFAYRPEIVLACANAWWCADTTIPAIERNSIEAWSRLFAIPCLTATNL